MANIRALFRGDERAGGGHALPGSVDLDPGIHEAFAVHVGLTFFSAFYAKYADNYRGVAVDLHCGLLCDGLRGLVIGGFDTGEEFAFGGDAAVDIDGDHSVGEKHLQSFGVFFFESEIPGFFESKHTAALVTQGLLLGSCQGATE